MGAGVVSIGILFFLTHFLPGAAPWVSTGRLAVVVRAVPYSDTDLTLTVGIDTMELISEGARTQVSIRTRRATLDSLHDTSTLLFDTAARVGTYDGFSFTMTSPELRNPWEGDSPPSIVTLAHDQVFLPVSYTVVEGKTTVVILSFETISSMHEQEGGLVYVPTIQVETRTDASVVSQDTSSVYVEGGTIVSNSTYGMDWDGRMRRNFRATDPLAELVELEPALIEVSAPLPSSTAPFITEEDGATSTATTTDTEL